MVPSSVLQKLLYKSTVPFYAAILSRSYGDTVKYLCDLLFALRCAYTSVHDSIGMWQSGRNASFYILVHMFIQSTYETAYVHLPNYLSPVSFDYSYSIWTIYIRSLMIDIQCISCESFLRWMFLDFNDDESTLARVIAWFCAATNQYMRQCWTRLMSPYGVTSQQWFH